MNLAAALLLCLLAMTVFAASVRLGRRSLLALAVGSAAAVLLSYIGLPPDPAGIAAVVIGVVSVHLWTRFSALALPTGLAVLSVSLHGLLLDQGLPGVAVAIAALLVPGTLLWTTHKHPGLANPALHLEAMVLILVLAVVLGAAPAVVTGWHSAIALNASMTSTAPASSDLQPSSWLIPICLAPLLFGALYSLWGRRRRC